MEHVPFRFRLEYWGYKLFEALIVSIPDRILPAVATVLAGFVFHVVRIRRQVTLQNLAQAFPDHTSHWHRQVGYQSYRHFVLVISQFMKMARWDADKLYNLVTESDVDNFLNDYQKNHGVVVVSGHFGNWEVGIGYLHLLGIRSAVIQQRQKNPLVDAHMRRLRERWGMEVIYTHGAVRNSLSRLKQGKLVALLGDQDAGDRGVFVPFFKRFSSTHVGAAILSLKSQAPLYFAACIRKPDGHYHLHMEKVFDSTMDVVNRENVQKITAEFTARLESWIRRYPEQYFWMHRRWKTVPPESEKL